MPTLVTAPSLSSSAIDLWKEVRRDDLAWKHRSLSELLIALLEQQCGRFGVEVTSPRDYDERGGHITIRHSGAGSITEALLANGVVSSFRKPDWIRFGLQALALSHEDLWIAVARLRKVLETDLWRDPKFAKVSV